MQQIKSKTNFSELEAIASDKIKMTNALADVMDKFKIRANFAIFDNLKSKGLAMSSLFSILVMLPFYGIDNVYALVKSGLHKLNFTGKKDTYYDAKNEENIDWRRILMLHAKRFKYLISKNIYLKTQGITAQVYDDSLVEKTGKKTEKVSMVYDHVSNRFVLGYKLLVCGFWDGASFIPLDFSLHREKGKRQEAYILAWKKADKEHEKLLIAYQKNFSCMSKKETSLNQARQEFKQHPTKTNKQRLEKKNTSYTESKNKHNESRESLDKAKQALGQARKDIKRFYVKDKLFGLSSQERKEQFKKNISTDSFGNQRRRETDMDKISCMLKMLGRSVKNGFMADYVLTDSWFFCYALLVKLSQIKNGKMKLISMVKINNQIFTHCKTGKQMHVGKIPALFRSQEKECRKLKSKYIKVGCYYKDIRVNLFYIKMGKSQTWHLLVTTDLNLTFIKLMEVYQIRWSIEVFFKESKQFLNLGGCKSSNFDAQIADTTISMIQHIMLTYFKRMNYQQSFGGLFQNLKKEISDYDLVNRMLAIFWELAEILCITAGIDFISVQRDLVQNEELLDQFIRLIPDRLNKAA